jgi:hypothetical protein
MIQASSRCIDVLVGASTTNQHTSCHVIDMFWLRFCITGQASWCTFRYHSIASDSLWFPMTLPAAVLAPHDGKLRKHHPGKRFWKVLAPNHRHLDHIWHAGLNELQGTSFVSDPSIPCGPGRLYYCEEKDLHCYLGFGDHIQRIFEPTYDSTFATVQLLLMKGANKVYLDEQAWSLYDPATYRHIGLNIHDNIHIVRLACETENWSFLNEWKKQQQNASGHTWILKYQDRVMDEASKRGQVRVLQWWRDSGFPCKYSKAAIHSAIVANQLDSLKWWKTSGLSVKYDEDYIVDTASMCGRLHIVQWLVCDSGWTFHYSHRIMDACTQLTVPVFDWWVTSGFTLKYTCQAIDRASAAGRIDLLNWWKDSGLLCLWSTPLPIMPVHAAQWWVQCGMHCVFDDTQMF